MQANDPATGAKRCQDCGLDVSDMPRVKDKQGRYRCKACEEMRVKEAAPPVKPKGQMVPTTDGAGMIELAPEPPPQDMRPRAIPVGSETLPPGQTMKCRHCGYDLRGLLVPKCPECGKIVSLTRSERNELDSRERLNWAYKKPVLIFGVCSAIVMAILFSGGGEVGEASAAAGNYWANFVVRLTTVTLVGLLLQLSGVSLESSPVLLALRWAAALAAGSVGVLLLSFFGPLVLIGLIVYFFIVIGVLWDLTDADMTDVILSSFIGVACAWVASLVVPPPF